MDSTLVFFVVGGAIVLVFMSFHGFRDVRTWPPNEFLTMMAATGVGAAAAYWMRATQEMRHFQLLAQQQRARTYEALVWWSSEGKSLAKDSSYVLATVRHLNGKPGGKSREQVMAEYQDSSDPCATVHGAQQTASFALKHLPQLVADHTELADRNYEGLTRIFRRHFRRDIVLLEEAKNYQLNTAVHGVADESPTHLVERLLREFNAVSLAREQGLKRIQELAAALPEDKREQYVAAAIAGINASLDAWMLTQANRTN